MQPDKTLPVKHAHFLINRNFALLWGGQIISFAGDFIFDTTLILWIATLIARGQRWAPLAVSGVLAAASIAVFVVGPIAGVFADRWDKRRTMLKMDAARAILMILLLFLTGVVALPFLPAIHLSTYWQLGSIYLIVFLASSCSQFFNPAVLTLISDIVEADEQARATGLIQTMAGLAGIFGPSLATLLFFSVGVQWAILLDAFSFVISFLAVLLIRAPKAILSVEPGQQGHFWREFGEGLRFFATSPVLTTILITGVLIMFYEGSYQALGVFFVTQNLHAPVSSYGFLGTALAAGLTVGALLAGMLAQRIGVARMFWAAIIVEGVLTLIFARMSLFLPALALLGIMGGFIAAVNVAATPLMLRVTPKQLIGRVAAVVNPVMNLALLLSVSLAGFLDSAVLHSFHSRLLGLSFGSIDTIFLVTGVIIVASGIYSMIRMRGLDVDQPS